MFNRIVCVIALLFSSTVFALEVGDTAPQIIGRDISGGLFALSRMEDKPKVINFFWVKCVPCQKEIPLLAKKEKEHPNVAFAVIHAEMNIDTESNYDITDIQAFTESLPASPNTMVLGSDRLKQQYGFADKGFPISFLLSKENKVEKILLGFNDKTIKQLNDWLEQY